MIMVSLFLVARKAGIILVAAFELDGNNIQLGMPVNAAGLIVHRFAKDVDSADLGDFKWFQNFFLRKCELSE